MIIRIADVNGAIRGNFDREEKMGAASSSYAVYGVANGRKARCRRDTDGNAAVATADINCAVVLIDTDAANLADSSCRCRIPVSESSIN